MLDMPSASGSDDQPPDSISSDAKNKPRRGTKRADPREKHPLDVLAGWNQLKDWPDADRIIEMMRAAP
jgi:hypothetical protein